MKQQHNQVTHPWSQSVPAQGQSLVETALTIPILIFLIAGLVELSNLLITQNRVSTAARVGTSFGASNFTPDEFAASTDWATEMALVATNNVTGTLDLDPDRWDIYVVKATITADATAPSGFSFSEWIDVHGYGNQLVQSQTAWDAGEASTQADMLASLLATDESTIDPDGVQVVGTFTYHHRSTVLRLPVFDLGDLATIRGFNVSRVDTEVPFSGCYLAPITVYKDQHSAYPTNWTGGPLYPENTSDPVDLFPTGFAYPSPDPTYTVPNPTVFDDPSNYLKNVPGVPLVGALPDYLYWAREQSGAGGFGWLDWDDQSNAGDLSASMVYPGDFLSVYPVGNTNVAFGDGDGVLEVGEWVMTKTGNTNSSDINAQMEFLIDSGRVVKFIVYETQFGTGSSKRYLVDSFLVARIIGYQYGGSGKWILIEFIDWSEKCDDINDQ